MSQIDLTLTYTPLDPDPLWSIDQFHQNVVQSITGVTTTSKLIIGQVNGVTPSGSLGGPWLDNGAWKYWNGSAWVPTLLQIGTGLNKISLTGTPSANRSVNFPDKSGTVALTTDVFTGRGTSSLSLTATAPASTIADWNTHDSFYASLDRNISIRNDNSQPGEKVIFGLYQPVGGTYTVDWQDVRWEDSTPPTTITAEKAHLVELINCGGTIYGRLAVSNADVV